MKKRTPITLDIAPITEEFLKPAEFLELTRKHPEMIQSSKVVSPKLGAKDFGSIWVRYTRPLYRHLV